MEHPTANINTLTAEVEALLADAVATDARGSPGADPGNLSLRHGLHHHELRH